MRRAFYRAEAGVPGVYTGLRYRAKKMIIPVLVVAAFLLLSYFCVSNALYASGSVKVDRITIFCSEASNRMLSSQNIYRVYSRSAGVTTGYEEFFEKIEVHACSDFQLNGILQRYSKDVGDQRVRYIVIDENNELLEYYVKADFRDVLRLLVENGYLEGK